MRKGVDVSVMNDIMNLSIRTDGPTEGGKELHMFRIYLTNLGKYNEGELIGEWVNMPIDEEDLEEVKARIGINDLYEEWFITDYENDFDIEVSEYENLDDLNEIAEVCEEAYDPDAVKAVVYFGYATADDIQSGLDDIICIGQCGWNSEDETIGHYFADCMEIPENIEPYFDYEKFGRDIRLEGNFAVINDTVYEMVD